MKNLLASILTALTLLSFYGNKRANFATAAVFSGLYFGVYRILCYLHCGLVFRVSGANQSGYPGAVFQRLCVTAAAGRSASVARRLVSQVAAFSVVSFLFSAVPALADHSTVTLHDGPRTVTADIDTQIIKPSNNPSYSGNTSYGDYVQDVHVHFEGPVDGNQYTYVVAGFAGGYGMPYTDPVSHLFYNFTQDGYFHGRSVMYIGSGATYPTISVTGFANATITNPTPTGANPASVSINIPKGAIPNYVANANGTVDLAIIQNGVKVQTLTVPAGLAVSVDNGTANFTNLTTYEPAQIAVVAHGYTQTPSGMTFTGNQSDGAYVYIPITQNGSTNTTFTPDGTGNATLNFSKDLFYNIKPNPTSATGGAAAGSQAAPVWVAPSTYISGYNSTADLLTNETYKQGVAQQNGLLSAYHSSESLQWQSMASSLQTIANNTANLSSGGGGGGNVTVNGTANVSDSDTHAKLDTANTWLSSIYNSINSTPNAWVASVQNATAVATNSTQQSLWSAQASAWTNSLSSALVPTSMIVDSPPDPGAGSADDFLITLPAAMGGVFVPTINVNPFSYGLMSTVVSWLKFLFSWFLAVRICVFAWKELNQTVATMLAYEAPHANQDSVHGGSAAQALNAVIVLTALVGLGAVIAVFFDNMQVSSGIAGFIHSSPWSGMPTTILYLASRLFPLAMITYYATLKLIFANKTIVWLCTVKVANCFAAF